MGLVFHHVLTRCISLALAGSSHVFWPDTNATSCNLAVGGSELEQAEEDERISMQVSLLQLENAIYVSRSKGKINQKVQERTAGKEIIGSMPTDLLRAAVPLVWTHVPKCGTSFVNSVVRLPGVCAGWPVGDDVYTTGDRICPDRLSCPAWLWYSRCPGLLKTEPGSHRPMRLGYHLAVGSHFEDVYDGHGLIMLRQPEQRMISQFNFGPNERFDNGNMTIADVAPVWAGCAVRMLVLEGRGGDWADCLPSPLEYADGKAALSMDDVVEAQRRLQGYAFVGITDDWALSICLLHAMFGGECHPAEFADVRLRRNESSDLYDTTVLEGFVDPYDGPLYEEALSIFKTKSQIYNVSQETCAPCFLSAGVDISSDASV